MLEPQRVFLSDELDGSESLLLLSLRPPGGGGGGGGDGAALISLVLCFGGPACCDLDSY